jgi:two-component system response regulator (stage 0 sporulation protein F)
MPHRILLVEADSGIRSVLQDILSDEGYEVVTTALPVAELADVAALSLDAIVLDYSVRQLPSARQMLDRIQACSATTSIPFIISTTLAKATEELAGMIRPQSDALISKPFAVDDMLQAVEHAVARRLSAHRELALGRA